MNKYVVILAAGKGTRMKSIDPNHSKVSYPILGKPLISYVLDAIEPLEPKETICVVGFGGETTKSIVESRSKVVWQKEILGTGHAVQQAVSYLKDKEGETLIIYGDTPLIGTERLQKIFAIHEKENNDLTIVSTVLSNPTGYGRLIREEKSNKLLAIVEESDCSKEQLYIDEANTGICVVNNKTLLKYLSRLTNNNNRHLYYLSQLVEMFVKDNLKVGSYIIEDAVEAFGINDRIQLSYAAKIMRKKVNQKLMLSGVSIEDPATTYISPDVEIGRDSVIRPNTTILGKSKIGEATWIGPNSYLENVTIGNDCLIESSYVINSEISSNECVGPFAKIVNNKKAE